ncbi:hypothetical protein Bbelb_201260 [Branchiostoma belcheri]|nr:hypothetical protein Bbelb_201260 [Branchiostoma belcheri]
MPVRSSLSGLGSRQTSRPPPQQPTVHLSILTGRVRYGKGASDKTEDGLETSSDTYEESEVAKRHTTYTSTDRTYQGKASGRRARCSVIRAHHSCLADPTAVGFSLVTLELVMDISHLSYTFNDRNQTTVMECLGDMEKMIEPDQDLKKVIRQLQTKKAARDQKIQALEQRPYIEHCESGGLKIPYKSLYDGFGHREHNLTAMFTRSFRKTPVVTLGFVTLDSDRFRNLRVAAQVTTKSTTVLTVRITALSAINCFNQMFGPRPGVFIELVNEGTMRSPYAGVSMGSKLKSHTGAQIPPPS